MHSVDRGFASRRPKLTSRAAYAGRRAALAVAAAVLPTLAFAGPASAEDSVGGGAYGLRASVNALLAPASLGALPSVTLPARGGGPFTESLLSANLVGLVPVRLAKVSTEGNSGIGTANSSATVLDVNLSGLVTAAAARSSCSATSSSAEATTSVVDLVVAGIPISTVNAGPNTSIALPVGTVIINEQRSSGASAITATAVRISLSGAIATGDVVIGQSRCEVDAATRARSKKLRRSRSKKLRRARSNEVRRAHGKKSRRAHRSARA